jgi:hypothetical protein
MITHGVKPNGDIISSASVTVFDCRGGHLDLTLLPKSSSSVYITLDGKVVLKGEIGGLAYWNGTAYVPASHRSDVCSFGIHTGLLLGSTQIGFTRP